MESFERQNLMACLRERVLLSTVTSVQSYCRRPVLEFYGNLTSEVGEPSSAKYGRVVVRNKICNFSPSLINNLYNCVDVETTEVNIDTATSIITGGFFAHFPALPQRLADASLTSLFYVLHKTAIRNWTPSTNSTNVTRPHVLVLHAIGTGSTFNFGRHVFDSVMAFADGGLKSTSLPFPSLIYSILVSQGFVPHVNETRSGEVDKLKLAPGLLKGNRKLDLPWTADGVRPSVAATGDNTTTTFVPEQIVSTQTEQGSTSVLISSTYLQSQLDFALCQIAYYEEQTATLRLVLQGASSSGQQGGVGGNGNDVDQEGGDGARNE